MRAQNPNTKYKIMTTFLVLQPKSHRMVELYELRIVRNRNRKKRKKKTKYARSLQLYIPTYMKSQYSSIIYHYTNWRRPCLSLKLAISEVLFRQSKRRPTTQLITFRLFNHEDNRNDRQKWETREQLTCKRKSDN